MKQVLYFTTILLIALLSFSCSDDDTSDNAQNFSESDLAGDYMMTSYRSQNGSTTSNGFNVDFSIVGKNFDFETLFSQDPNRATASGTYDVDVTFEFLGNTQTQEMTLGADELGLTGDWNIDGSVLVVTQDTGNTVRAEITTLTNTMLDLVIDLQQLRNQVFEGASVEGQLLITLIRI